MKHILKISQQTFWQLLGKVVTSFSTFIILGMIARIYGEEGTGIFTLALTYLAIFYLLSDFGFNAHVLKNLQFTIYNLQLEFRKLLGVRIIWSLILVGLAVGTLPLWPFASVQFSESILLGSLAILASGVFVTCNLIFQSKLRYDLSALASSIGTLFSLGVFIYLVSYNFPIPFLLISQSLGLIVIATVALILVKVASSSRISPIFDKQYSINLFRDSWPIAGTLFLNVVYFRADSFLIAIFRNNSEVGIYNIAYSVFQTALVLPTFIMNSYYPMLLKSFKGVRRVGLGLLMLALMGTLFTYILSPIIIKLITGEGFLGSVRSLQILSLGFPAYFVSSLLMWILVTRGKYKSIMSIYFLGLMINLILNLIFIPQYSFYGASWITVLSEYLILALQIASLVK